MHAEYPATYRDTHGEERTVIKNDDGKELLMVVRGVEFAGRYFADFEPTLDLAAPRLASFTFDQRELCGCFLECINPVPVVSGSAIVDGHLLVQLELGYPSLGGNKGIDHEGLKLCLTVGDTPHWSQGKSGWFEDELLDIQRALPEGVYMKACINCAFSDYSPGGNGLFGCMACFRENKAEYLRVANRRPFDKAAFFHVWAIRRAFVQKTYLCPAFERRRPGMGYRG
jgi:Family of unknown function (DUF6304)